MARIISVDIFMVDLQPMVRRTDAIQSFDSQQTPFVQITDSDGVTGLGYSYTIGQGGSAVMALLRDDLIGQLIGQDAEEIGRIWRDLLFSIHATAVGAISSLALAAIDIALWDLLRVRELLQQSRHHIFAQKVNHWVGRTIGKMAAGPW